MNRQLKRAVITLGREWSTTCVTNEHLEAVLPSVFPTENEIDLELPLIPSFRLSDILSACSSLTSTTFFHVESRHFAAARQLNVGEFYRGRGAFSDQRQKCKYVQLW